MYCMCVYKYTQHTHTYSTLCKHKCLFCMRLIDLRALNEILKIQVMLHDHIALVLIPTYHAIFRNPNVKCDIQKNMYVK